MGGMSRLTSAAAAASLLAVVLMLAMVAGTGARDRNDELYGPFGPQGPRLREQLWILPSADPSAPLRATVFRPADEPGHASPRRRPMVVINHGTSEQTRHSTAMPVFYWLSRWFVDRGYVVVLPQRRGHGATGGRLIEAVGNCSDPDHHASGALAATDISAAVAYMAGQDFVAADDIVIAGISTGGWASLAMASRNPPGVRAVINFAGGRGAHAYGRRNAVCGEAKLVEAAGRFGRDARVPSLWLYSENDSYFGPDLARHMHSAWIASGGRAEIAILPPHGADGHGLVDDPAGWRLWGAVVDGFLARHAPPKPVLEEANAGVWSAASRTISAAIRWVAHPEPTQHTRSASR
jgi:dienelactone hydrolase